MGIELSNTRVNNRATPQYNAINPADVRTVHLIQSNHFDAGFADFVPAIMNRYFTGGEGTGAPPTHNNVSVYYNSFYLTAGNISDALKVRGGPEGYKYLTQSWLVDFFFDCPLDFPTIENGTILNCPNKTTYDSVMRYIQDGTIYWHAFPHNAQPELMDETFFVTGLNISLTLANEMGILPQQVMSQRDVTGLTRALVPILKRNNIIGISIGTNTVQL